MVVAHLLGEENQAEHAYLTQVNAVDLHGNAKIFAVGGSALVTWDLVFEASDWGVKNIDVVLKRVKVNLKTEHGETGEAQDFVALWDMHDPKGWKTQVVQEGATLPLSVYPREVAVYLQDRRIEVKF